MKLYETPALRPGAVVSWMSSCSPTHFRIYLCEKSLRDVFEIPPLAKKVWLAVYDEPARDRVKVTIRERYEETFVLVDGKRYDFYDFPGLLGQLLSVLLIDRDYVYVELWYQE